MNSSDQPAEPPPAVDRNLKMVAMQRAFELAALGPAHGPNPRVGCVILDAEDQVIGEGYHQGRGTAHAEAMALADARTRHSGSFGQGAGATGPGVTAVVTLEPCAHHGHTPPCTKLLRQAGIQRVIAAAADPNPTAAGGGKYLAEHGVQVELDVAAVQARELNYAWWKAVTSGLPYVTLKLASSLDGRIAAPDGTSQWITGLSARAHVHQVRAQVDAIVVGSGTVAADDPALTARRQDGTLAQTPQPLRIIQGLRSIPPDAAIYGPGGETLHLTTHDPTAVLDTLAKREVRHVLIEGGATLAGAWLGAGLVDRVLAYVAPVVLGAGLPAISDFGVKTLDQAERFATKQVTRLGQDVLIEARKD